MNRGRGYPNQLTVFSASVTWGGFIFYAVRIFSDICSRQAASPLATAYAVVLTCAAAVTAKRSTHLSLPIRAILFAAICTAALAGALSARIFYGILPYSPESNFGNLLLLADDVCIPLILLIFPAFSASFLLGLPHTMAAVLTGTGTGMLAGGIFAVYSVHPLFALIMLAIPLPAVSLFAPRTGKNHGETRETRTLPVLSLIFGYTALGLLAGIIYVWLLVIGSFSGIHMLGYAAPLFVLTFTAAAGCRIGEKLNRKGLPSSGFLLMSAGSASAPLLFIAARIVISNGTLFSLMFRKQTAGVLALSILVGGIPCFLISAAVPALLHTGAARTKNNRLLSAVVFSVSAAAGLSLVGISTGHSLFINSLLVACAGLAGYAASAGGRKLFTAAAAGIIVILLLSSALVIPGLTAPLVYSGYHFNAQFTGSGNIPEAITEAYRPVIYAEHPGGWYADMQNRNTRVTYTFFNGSIYVPGEFYRDDYRPLFLIGRTLTKKDPETILYGGLSKPSLIGPLSAYFPRSRIIIAEDFPGHTEMLTASADRGLKGTGLTAVHRDIRGVMNTGSGRFGLIINVPPLPASAGSLRRYSAAFFTKALKHLDTDGVFVHLLPCYKISPSCFASVLRSFTDVFGTGSALWTFDNYCILTGTKHPLKLNEQDYIKRFNSSDSTLPFTSHHELLACFVADGLSVTAKLKHTAPAGDFSGYSSWTIPPLMSDNEILYYNSELLLNLHSEYSALMTGSQNSHTVYTFFRGRERYLEARLSWINGNIKRAVRIIQEAITINPQDVLPARFRDYMEFRRNILLARDFHRKSRNENALHYFKKAAGFKELSPVHIAEIGEIHLENSKASSWPSSYTFARKSLGYLAKSIQAAPDFSRADIMACEALLILKLTGRAENVINRVQLYDTTNRDTQRILQDIDRIRKEQKETASPDEVNIISSAIKGLTSEDNPVHLRKSISTLSSAGTKCMPFLIKAFSSASSELKKRIFLIMANIGGDPVIQFLRNRINAEPPEIAAQSFEMIRIFGDGRDIPLIAEYLRPQYQPNIRSKAVITLSNMKHPASIPLLLEALADPEKAVRLEAFNALSSAHSLFNRISSKGFSTSAAAEMLNAYRTIDPENIAWPYYPGEPGRSR